MEEDDDVYTWTPEDYKRASATSALDFARFDAMREFDDLRFENSLNFVSNSHLISREDYALLINESIQDVLPEALKKKMELKGGECQSEEMKKKKKKMKKKMKKKKKKIEKKPSNKNKLYGDLSPADVFQYYAEAGDVVYDFEAEDPKFQAEVAEKSKLFVETLKWLKEIYDREGPVAAEAKAKAANEAKAKAKAKA